MLPHTTTIRVRYQETDQMGVVYHGNYFVWFEVGRTSFIRAAGTSYGELEKKGILLPVIEVNCQYKLAARFEDDVIIETVIDELTPAKIRFSYRAIRASDDKLLANGETLHMWVNGNMRPLNLRRNYPHIYTMLEQYVG